MIEIKFKVWDKDDGEWVTDYDTGEPSSIQFDCDGQVQAFRKDLVDELVNGEHEQYEKFNIVSNIDVVQYTGLKDKNGIEIYKGDIFPMGVIMFSRGCFNGCYISGSTNDRGWDYSDDWEDGLYSYARNHEVIGNIYENPELLIAKG